MDKHILFMPDGNRRYAKREGISLNESYLKGAKSLKLLSDFFLLDNGWNQLTMHFMSKYTHERTDGSLDPIYDALIIEFSSLSDEKYFEKNDIKFCWIDHSKKMPSELVNICGSLSEKTENGTKVSLNLLGYDLDMDEKMAFKKAKTYEKFKEYRLVPEIDLVLRTTEMRLSKGPVYAMSQAQMLLVDKLNPEISKNDLECVLSKYGCLLDYRKTTNPIHK